MVKEILVLEFDAEFGKHFRRGGCCTGPMCPVNCAH